MHLSDEKIQSYLDDLMTEEHDLINRHLAECDDCRSRLFLYEQLGKTVTMALEDEAPDNFEAIVMARLKAIRHARRISDIVTICIGLGGFVLIALMFLLSSELRDALSFYFQEAQQTGGSAVKEIASIPNFAVTFCSAIFLILFFAGIDRLVAGKLLSASDRAPNTG